MFPDTYSLKRTIAPVEEHLTFFDLKAFLRVDTDDENDLIERLGIASREFIERATNRQIMTATMRLTMDQFWCDGSGGIIEVPRPPLQSITSLVYVDTNGTTQSLTENTDFVKDTDSEPGRIYPAYGKWWPSVRQFPGAVTLTFVAGWADADDVPEALKQAVRLLAGHWYRNREAVLSGTISKEVEFAIESLVYAEGLQVAV